MPEKPFRPILPCLALYLVALAAPAAPDRAPATAPATQPAPAGDVSVNKLIEQLGDEDFRVRESATEKIRQMGPSALPALREAVRHDDPEVRSRIESLIASLEGRDPKPRREDDLPPLAPRGGMFGARRSITSTSINGNRIVRVSEEDRQIIIRVAADGSIAISVRQMEDGKQVTREYRAKNADELKKEHPDAWRIYQQYGRGGGAIQLRVGPGLRSMIAPQPQP